MNAPRMQEQTLDGPHGAIRVRRYRAERDSPLASLVWLHGGSFLSGDLDMPEADYVARRLAADGIEVCTVDYQLAPVPPEFAEAAGGIRPGVHYPVAVEEAEHVYARLTSTTGRGWALGGASAGGALAASVASRAAAAGRPVPTQLVLVYPLLHRHLPDAAPELAHRLRGEQPVPTAQDVEVMNRNYLDEAASTRNRGAFAGDESLDGMPPTLIVDSDLDLLRASSQHFAADLVLAGREVHYVVEPATRHGHLNSPGPAADRSIDRISRWLQSTTHLSDELSRSSHS